MPLRKYVSGCKSNATSSGSNKICQTSPTSQNASSQASGSDGQTSLKCDAKENMKQAVVSAWDAVAKCGSSRRTQVELSSEEVAAEWRAFRNITKSTSITVMEESATT